MKEIVVMRGREWVRRGRT